MNGTSAGYDRKSKKIQKRTEMEKLKIDSPDFSTPPFEPGDCHAVMANHATGLEPRATHSSLIRSSFCALQMRNLSYLLLSTNTEYTWQH
jgi:hypothetical protein